MAKNEYDIIIRQQKIDSPTYATAYSVKGLGYLRKYVPKALRLQRYEITVMPDVFMQNLTKGLKIGGQSPGTRSIMLLNPPLH